jgi:carbonic anhydrase
MTTSRVTRLLDNNRAWAAQVQAERPGFFAQLAAQQTPQVLWIGCADSRVPANQILGLDPGEVFVHRNVANLVNPGDLNALTVIAYAVDALQVTDIVVCGHSRCGGVAAVHGGEGLGMLGDWLWPVRTIRQAHAEQLDRLPADDRLHRLVELNVVEQVRNVAGTSVVQAAWAQGQTLAVHGWVYGLEDGIIRDLGISAEGPDELAARYTAAIAAAE